MTLVAVAAAATLWWSPWRSRGEAEIQGAASAAGPAGPRGGRSGGRDAQPVLVQAVRTQDVRVTASAIGTVLASNNAVVRPQVSGLLQSVHFREGQQVQAGQLLAQIDPRSFQAQVGQAEGVLARDSAQLENARLDLQRYQGLAGKDAIARQQLDNQAALVRQLEGTVKTDTSNLENARLQLSYTKVLAPTAGRVGLRQADIGNLVQPSDPNGIVTVAQTHPVNVIFALPSPQLPLLQARLRQAQPVPVQLWDKASASVLASGRVLTLDNAIDPATDTIKVKAQFANTDDALFPNQSVQVRLQLDLLRQVITVPQAAVLRGAPGFYVYVVSGDGRVSARPVKPGAVDGDWMAVEGSLASGEQVVVDGVDRLRDGAKVEVMTSAGRKPGGAARESASRRRTGAASAASATASAR